MSKRQRSTKQRRTGETFRRPPACLCADVGCGAGRREALVAGAFRPDLWVLRWRSFGEERCTSFSRVRKRFRSRGLGRRREGGYGAAKRDESRHSDAKVGEIAREPGPTGASKIRRGLWEFQRPARCAAEWWQAQSAGPAATAAGPAGAGCTRMPDAESAEIRSTFSDNRPTGKWRCRPSFRRMSHSSLRQSGSQQGRPSKRVLERPLSSCGRAMHAPIPIVSERHKNSD